jgi:DNA polymerase-3 subunit beta
MKFTVSSKVLYDNLSKIIGIVGSNNVITILDNLLFTIQDNKLEVLASDIENTMKVTMDVQANESGSIAVPAKKLMETIKHLPEQPLVFTISDQNIISFTHESGEGTLNGFDGNEFPELTALSSDNSVVLDAGVLHNAIQTSMFCIGNDENRKAMTGLFCQFDKDGTTFVATDAQKLTRYRRRDVTSANTYTFILPKKVLSQLKSALPEAGNEVELIFDKNHCSFKFQNVYLITRLIDSVYPDYNTVIPTNNPNVLIVNRNELRTRVNRLMPLSNQSTNLIVFHIVGSQLTITANDLDYANGGKEDMTVNYNGEDMTIGYNGRYLSEILSTMHSEEVMIEMSTPGRACLLFPNDTDEKESILMLVMPLMVTS